MWDRKPPDPRFIIWFLGPMQVHPPNDISISSTVFVVLMVLNNTQTDHRQQLTMHAMWDKVVQRTNTSDCPVNDDENVSSS